MLCHRESDKAILGYSPAEQQSGIFALESVDRADRVASLDTRLRGRADWREGRGKVVESLASWFDNMNERKY